jgi:two-component system, OmpR family, response regulator
MRVLVVEDERRLAAGLRNGLAAEGFAVDVALDGTDGLWMAREHPYDAIVLDIMLPGVNGYRLCSTLRREGVWTPILMLTAKDGELDEVEALDNGADDYLTKPFSYAVLLARLRALLRRGARERPAVLEAGDLRLDPAARRAWRGEVEALDNGADDYLTKPFSYAVLLARLRALLRRGARERPAVLEAGDLRLDPAARRAWRGEVEVELTARELALLEFLLRRRGEAVPKREILQHVWDDEFEGDPNIVEVYVRHLRNKLDRPFGRAAIQTVRGTGYRLVADGG